MMTYQDDSYTRHNRVCRFNTEIDEKLHAAFKEMCIEEDIPVKQAVDTMIRLYLEDYNNKNTITSIDISKKQKMLQDDLLRNKEVKRIIDSYLTLISLSKGK